MARTSPIIFFSSSVRGLAADSRLASRIWFGGNLKLAEKEGLCRNLRLSYVFRCDGTQRRGKVGVVVTPVDEDVALSVAPVLPADPVKF